MRKYRLLLALIIAVIIAIASYSCSYADLSPQRSHHVLVVGTNTGSAFPKDINSGYSSETLIWLLNRLGFRTTLYVARDSLKAAELTFINFTAGNYDAAFLCDVTLASHLALMPNFKAACLATNTRGYVLAKGNGTIGGVSGYWAVGALDQAQYWEPSTAACPMLTPTLGLADTLWLHDYLSTTRLSFIPDESLTINGGLAERLIWKADQPDTCLMWRWNSLITLCHVSPMVDLTAFLIASQFVRDMEYTPYKDYIPLPMTFQLDADGMTTGPDYCGPALGWVDLADSIRAVGLKHIYFGPYEEGFNIDCDEFAGIWSSISDIVKIRDIHRPNGVATWSAVTSDSAMQRVYSNSWENFRAKLSPAPDSIIRISQVHQYEWSIMNAKFFLKKGLKVLNAVSYVSNVNTYVRQIFTCRHMRLRPCSPTGWDSTGAQDSLQWIQLMPFWRMTNGTDVTTYAGFYAFGGHNTPHTAYGYCTAYMTYWLCAGFEPYQHVESLKTEPVLSRCWIHGVFKPFIHATSGLWELDNTPENLKRLTIRQIPTR